VFETPKRYNILSWNIPFCTCKRTLQDHFLKLGNKCMHGLNNRGKIGDWLCTKQLKGSRDQERRNGAGRHRRHHPHLNFFKCPKVPFLWRKVPFLYKIANVAVNTRLKSKVPFLFGNFDAFKNNLVKNVQFRYGVKGTFPSPPGKFVLGALFNIQKCPWKPVPSPPPNLLMLPTPLSEISFNINLNVFPRSVDHS
jgi:hypothetical protein